MKFLTLPLFFFFFLFVFVSPTYATVVKLYPNDIYDEFSSNIDEDNINYVLAVDDIPITTLNTSSPRSIYFQYDLSQFPIDDEIIVNSVTPYVYSKCTDDTITGLNLYFNPPTDTFPLLSNDSTVYYSGSDYAYVSRVFDYYSYGEGSMSMEDFIGYGVTTRVTFAVASSLCSIDETYIEVDYYDPNAPEATPTPIIASHSADIASLSASLSENAKVNYSFMALVLTSLGFITTMYVLKR